MNIRVTFGFHLPTETPASVLSAMSGIQLAPDSVIVFPLEEGVVIGPLLTLGTDPCLVTPAHLKTLRQIVEAFKIEESPRWWVVTTDDV